MQNLSSASELFKFNAVNFIWKLIIFSIGSFICWRNSVNALESICVNGVWRKLENCANEITLGFSYKKSTDVQDTRFNQIVHWHIYGGGGGEAFRLKLKNWEIAKQK